MNFQIIWEAEAVSSATRFIKDDPDGLREVFLAVDLLGREPRPAGSTELGSRYLRRLHVGRYRVIYEIAESAVTVVVVPPGRVG